jgi:outer membrane receptor protein involved in Fe transport
MGDFGQRHFLKVRGSYGQTGNAGIPTGLDASQYRSDQAYGSQNILAVNGTYLTSIGVSNLKWETTNNLDFGLDFGFFDNRINGSLAYYNKYVEDLLLAVELPPSAGIASIYGNIGDLVNRGVELNVVSNNLNGKKLQWQTSFNIAFNHNEVKKLTPQIDRAGTGMMTDISISKTGFGVRDAYIADFAGVDPQTGISQIYALDQEHYAATGETRRLKDSAGNDVTLISNATNANGNRFHFENKNNVPKYYGGLTNRFSWKSFDLGFLITFSGGNYFFDGFYRNLVIMNSSQYLEDIYLNHWKKPGDNAKFQRMTWSGTVNLEDGTTVGVGDLRGALTTQYLFKGDYIKLKSVNIGYTLNKLKWLNTLRVYATLENLYTVSDYPGWDPEGMGSNIDNYWDLPPLFSATIGLSVKF